MCNYHSLLAGIILTFSLGFQTSIGDTTQNSAEGTLSVDGKISKISYAYADESDGDITIFLADSPIPKEAIPDTTYDLGAEGGFRGIVFSVSRSSQELQKDGLYGLINAIHFYPVWNQLGSIGNGEITISELSAEVLTGRIVTPADNQLAGHDFSYDVAFSVSLEKELVEFMIVNADDAPSQAFALWAKALFDGDVVAYRQHAAAELVEMLPDNVEELAMGLEFQRESFPPQVAILESTISGNEAVLNMAGRKGASDYEGTVTMLLENGNWKVGMQSWSSASE